jgi:hypothetical protein
MPKPVWTDSKAGLRPKLADDEINCGAREASAFAGAVEIDEERTVFRATGLKHASSTAFVGSGNVTGLGHEPKRIGELHETPKSGREHAPA